MKHWFSTFVYRKAFIASRWSESWTNEQVENVKTELLMGCRNDESVFQYPHPTLMSLEEGHRYSIILKRPYSLRVSCTYIINYSCFTFIVLFYLPIHSKHFFFPKILHHPFTPFLIKVALHSHSHYWLPIRPQRWEGLMTPIHLRLTVESPGPL